MKDLAGLRKRRKISVRGSSFSHEGTIEFVLYASEADFVFAGLRMNDWMTVQGKAPQLYPGQKVHG